MSLYSNFITNRIAKSRVFIINYYYYIDRCIRWLISFIRLQLFITLIAWPFLIMWGLPLSLLSPLGNLIFAPFLSIFLIMCALVGMTELCSIPNELPISLLEIVSSWWLYFVHFGSRSCLIAIPTSHFYVVSLIAVMACVILWTIRTPLKSISTLVSLYGLILILNYCWQPPHHMHEIAYGSTTLLLQKTDAGIVLIDPGCTSRSNPRNWVKYILLPVLAKQFGETTLIEHRLQKNTTVSQALQKELRQQGCLKK